MREEKPLIDWVIFIATILLLVAIPVTYYLETSGIIVSTGPVGYFGSKIPIFGAFVLLGSLLLALGSFIAGLVASNFLVFFLLGTIGLAAWKWSEFYPF